ncbi:hypothetical protein [Streptomyces zaehneri]|uniref:hypothetical protein n=1 Tax=Streptomyces zaehneri TaxID=3051180 RepID=UPI0037DA72CF
MSGTTDGGACCSVLTLVLAEVHDPATAGSVSGPLPTAQQLGGPIGVTAAKLAYYAPAAEADTAWRHAMLHQVAAFEITELISLLAPRPRVVQPDTPAAVTLLSDGVTRLVGSFELTTWETTLTVLDASGSGELIRLAREAEGGDPDGRRWPRGRARDDATVLHPSL